ncbi:MAG TPA: hypothetical protein EYG93_11335 [Sulfurospirillum arcachonense]|nr:hypothetical protein [Sulfurospirillum arcachonense]
MQNQILLSSTSRLGQWYTFGEGKRRFECKKVYPLLDAPHKVVHQTVHDNIAIVAEGGGFQVHEVEPIVENFKTMEKASTQLFGLLNELTKDDTSCEKGVKA